MKQALILLFLFSLGLIIATFSNLIISRLIANKTIKGALINSRWKKIFTFIGGLIPVIIYLKFHNLVNTIVYSFFLYLLLILSFIDLKTFIVPNPIVFLGILVGLVYSFLTHHFLEHFYGALLGFSFITLLNVVYEKVRGLTPLGFGDAKFLALVGSFLGYKAIFPTLLAGSIIALLINLVEAVKCKTFNFAFPFIPYLTMGAIIYLFLIK